ncbi:MAG: 50S ribosomal protein L10 [Chloroflexi bacterium]|nr:50S ribosomal protein L10 [Chloroflexota bacterium]
MPTERKIQAVEELTAQIRDASIVITTDYTGLPVSALTDFRRALRQKGVEYHVIKNTLAYLAAEAAGKAGIKEVIEGPTGIAFGSGDPVEPAKAISDFIRTTRSIMKIRGAFLDGSVLSPAEVEQLAALPPKEVLVARLLGQVQAPISGLVYVLNGLISGLARVLQGRVDNLNKDGGAQEAVPV